MSDTVPGTYTVQIYANTGQAYVVGVKNKEYQSDVVSYVKKTKKGELEGEWYELYNNDELLDVVQYARTLDNNAKIYKLSRDFSVDVGKYVVPFYVQNTDYKLCAMKESDQQTALETFITRPSYGEKEVDWYQVDYDDDVEKIMDYAKGIDVQGTIYNLADSHFVGLTILRPSPSSVTPTVKISDTGAPGVCTVQIYVKNGQAYVVGVKNKDIQNEIISYIKYVKKGEKDQDWYELFSNDDLLDVAKRARILDDSARIYQLSPRFTMNVGKYVILFYVQDTDYRLCSMKESDQKTALKSFIMVAPIDGKKEADWYRVDNEDDIKKIIKYAKGDDVRGVIYDLTYLPNK